MYNRDRWICQQKYVTFGSSETALSKYTITLVYISSAERQIGFYYYAIELKSRKNPLVPTSRNAMCSKKASQKSTD